MSELTKDFLDNEYIQLAKSIYQIAKETGSLPRTVKRALISAGLTIRPSSSASQKPDRDILIDLHHTKKLTPHAISKQYGVSPAAVAAWLESYGLKIKQHQKCTSPPQEVLKKLHLVERRSVGQLSIYFCVTPRVVKRWLKEANIERQYFDLPISTPSQTELTNLLSQVKNKRQRTKKIMEAHGVCAQIARKWLRSYQFAQPTKIKKIYKDNTERNRLIANDYISGISALELAKRYNLNHMSIYRILERNGVKRRALPNKIDLKLRSHIMNEYGSSDLTMSEVGQKYNIDGSTIQKWVAKEGLSAKPPGRSSAIERWLKDQLGGDFGSDRKTMGFELDLFSPTHQMAVELCGMYWHSEQRGYYPKNYHYNKYLSCRTSGITLLTIFEDEWLKNRDLVLSIVESKLGKFTKRIAARKCKVQPLSSSTAKSFFDQFHIQGGCQSTESAGLIHNDELVAAMSLGPHHRDSKTLVLNRLCFAPRTQVIGGASRLLSHLTKGRALVSWSDNRWSTGKVYEELGFKLDREYGPDYSYTNNRERLHKQRFKKSLTGCPQNVLEAEWAKQHGWYRIWDCGKKRWVLDPR